jgi:Protein of unknown function (DUF1091)
MIYSVTGKLCEMLEAEKFIIPDLRKYSNLPEAGICPIPKGEYRLEPFQLPVEKASIIPPGRYVFGMLILTDGRIIGGFSVQFSLGSK